MTDLAALGWDVNTIGELDHQQVKAPYVKLTSCTTGENGDRVFFYDLRVCQPNQEVLSTIVLHSFEHLLLAGFRRYYSDHFICVAPMGCQTGFYLVLLNEGDASTLCNTYEQILTDILHAKEVPYANLKNCGQAAHHNLSESQELARSLLNQKDHWRHVL